MKCPICTSTDLVLSERQGVEIDYCPDCRGLWLDRGELDKIIERSNGQPNSAVHLNEPSSWNESLPHGSESNYHHEHEHERKNGSHYRRKSWLGALFD